MPLALPVPWSFLTFVSITDKRRECHLERQKVGRHLHKIHEALAKPVAPGEFTEGTRVKIDYRDGEFTFEREEKV